MHMQIGEQNCSPASPRAQQSLLDERDARSWRAVSLDGAPFVPQTITCPREVTAVALERLRELQVRVGAR